MLSSGHLQNSSALWVFAFFCINSDELTFNCYKLTRRIYVYYMCVCVFVSVRVCVIVREVKIRNFLLDLYNTAGHPRLFNLGPRAFRLLHLESSREYCIIGLLYILKHRSNASLSSPTNGTDFHDWFSVRVPWVSIGL